MERIIKYALATIFTIVNLPVFAQEVEMADTMRSEGKIYVVVAIILIVLFGLIAYLFMLDKKVTNLEKRINNKI